MPLAAGERLGPYTILVPIGAGGMGEVYKARDTKLDREVAIKVLPSALARDPERLARFEREAKVLASLNHPNIGQIYGIEDASSGRALVMELVPGQTLRSPLPPDEALRIAGQVAEALEAAHDKGIIHRDLKPANIMITPAGVAKVLDFGLAAISQPNAGNEDPADSPTLTMAATQAGVIMGTAAYMSPEQAVGKPVDKRADVWSFGVVLYEMLTGKRLFDGETVSHVLADVIRADIDFKKLPDATPPPIRDLLKRCLDRNARNRLRDIGEARIAIQKYLANPEIRAERPQQTDTRTTRKTLWAMTAVTAAAVLAVAALFFLRFHQTPPVETYLRLSVPLSNKFGINYLALSPDGRTVVVSGSSGDKSGLWLRALDSLELRPLANTENARHPFWSPDGRSLGFFADGKLKLVAATGGPATPLCDAGTGSGGAWSREGVILFGADNGPIQRVNAAGGPCTPITRTEAGVRHRLPAFLPDGNHFLYLSQSADQSKAGLYVAALNQPAIAGRRLLPDRSSAIFVPHKAGASHDYFLFQRENTLMAQPFDTQNLQLAGDSFAIAPHLSRTSTPAQVAASVAANGTVIYLAGDPFDQFQPTWLDRTGKELSKVGPPADDNSIAPSPDQKTVAIAHRASSPRAGVWLRELARDVEIRFVAPPFTGPSVWSPDSSRIAFSGPRGLYMRSASGGPIRTQDDQSLLERDHPTSASDWSHDGKYLLYTEIDPKTRGDIWVLPLVPSGKPGAPFAFLKTEFNESQGQFSPDGHWVAYVSNESGQSAVYVRSFPAGGGPLRVSGGSGSGTEPRWRGDGKELYYLRGGDPHSLMAASMKWAPGGSLQVDVPRVLFMLQTRTILPEDNIFSYSPSPDGQRFLMNVLPDTAPPTLNIITNWEKAAGK